jgi:hypothetical protein
MRALSRWLGAALACITICASSALAAAGEPDQATAERILGPQWKSLSRRAGMVFAGTVLSAGPQTARTDRTVSAIELSFRVDRPIAGVARGQILTIHEWTGAWSRHRAMRSGEHLLLFLYPPSRLGLTSPVGGSLGQIALDASGQNVALQALTTPIKVEQLERAIRAARGE